VRAVVSLYAPTDLRWGYEHPANERVLDGPGRIRDFLGGTPASHSEAFKLASATSHVNLGTPPTLLFHGGRDQLVRDEHMGFLAGRLAQQHIPHRSVLIPYAQHGFDYNFDGWGSQIARQFISQFLAAHLEKR
jgi:dipeptidyl aminopeptidase/acylaminoacyl peptidase